MRRSGYRLLGLVVLTSGCASTVVDTPSRDALLDDVQRRTFDWFWEFSDPNNGLVRDAFNPTLDIAGVELARGRIEPGVGWFEDDYLGIDQGPIVTMIENYRSELVWDHMKRSPYIVRGLCRAGFRGGWLEGRCEA
jgi:hypothetical protein